MNKVVIVSDGRKLKVKVNGAVVPDVKEFAVGGGASERATVTLTLAASVVVDASAANGPYQSFDLPPGAEPECPAPFIPPLVVAEEEASDEVQGD